VAQTQAAAAGCAQVLQDMRKQGQLLQPLQPNRDLRIVKTQPSVAASPPFAGNSPDNKPNNINPAVTGQEMLWGLHGAVGTDSCLAAMQSGFTIVLRDMPKRCAAAGALVDALEAQLGLPAGANLYLTPSGMTWQQPRCGDRCRE
jgi:hypothetical protein